MKAHQVRELRELPVHELTGKLKDSRRELYELRFKMAVGQLENHQQIRQVRRDIARILTLIHEREDGVYVPEAETMAEPTGTAVRPARASAVAEPAPTPEAAANEPEPVDEVETETAPEEEEES